MPLPNDPVGAGADTSQWQNWLMSMLQPPAQSGADALSSSLTAHSGAPPWFQFGGFHPENIFQGHAGASLGRFDPNFPVNSAQLGGDTGGVPIGDTAAPAAGGGIGGDWRYPTAPVGGQGGVGSDARFPLANASPAGTSTAAPAARAVPGSPAARGINLGYYRPMTGNARQAQAMTYTDPNDPRIFRGPLAAPAAAPPATQAIPPTATASVPPAQNQWPQPPARPTGWPFNQ